MGSIEYTGIGFTRTNIAKEVIVEEDLFRFAEESGTQLFGILDGARSDEVLAKLAKEEVRYESLYQGMEEEDFLYEVSPFLVLLKKDTALFRWWTSERWGESLGIFFTSSDSFEHLVRHFQKFLTARVKDGNERYFRFYDPRVLRVYLPTCTVEELNLFFGNINCFIIESKDGKSILSFINNNDPISS